ncbi:MAG: hypothetical protein HIU89_07240 [Proteobacteria bacterium]|nr:hypothetical protein [Pseudomonadota bacterium]
MKDDKTIAEIAQQFEVHPTQVTEWRWQLLDRAADVFGSGGAAAVAAPSVDIKVPYAKIGQRALLVLGRHRCPRSARKSVHLV